MGSSRDPRIMAKFVIKKDGTKEPFDAEKIRRGIAAASKKANLSEERIKEVVEQVSSSVIRLAEGKEEIATAQLKAEILRQLDTVEPSISEAWRKYEQEKGRV